MASSLIRLHPNDNVLIARETLTLGAEVSIDGTLRKIRAQVPAGHKIAATKISKNAVILKYDTPIGIATRDVEPGEHLAILSAGAYGFTMSSNYNTRGRAAEVMVDGSKIHLIRERETIQSLFANEKVLPA